MRAATIRRPTLAGEAGTAQRPRMSQTDCQTTSAVTSAQLTRLSPTTSSSRCALLAHAFSASCSTFSATLFSLARLLASCSTWLVSLETSCVASASITLRPSTPSRNEQWTVCHKSTGRAMSLHATGIIRDMRCGMSVSRASGASAPLLSSSYQTTIGSNGLNSTCRNADHEASMVSASEVASTIDRISPNVVIARLFVWASRANSRTLLCIFS